METIGLIGGMSWLSTMEYYRLLNERVRDRLGGSHSARCLLHSVDFAEIEDLQAAGRWSQTGDLLAEAALSLERAGADVLLLCTNTMHTVADRITAATPVPFLHIVDVTAGAVRAAGLTRVGLLGTRYTMELGFYRERMAALGVETLVPEESDRDAVHDVIYTELVRGVIGGESRRTFRDVISRLADRGAEGVLLACTEIELLVGQDDSPVPVFPTTRLHAEAAVDHALNPVR